MSETRLFIKGIVERLAKIKAEVKYAQVIKIQNNIQNNSDITSAGSKDKCQVDTCPVFLFVENGSLCKHFFHIIKNGYRTLQIYYQCMETNVQKRSFCHLRLRTFPRNE